jgi:hypothetical protein
LAAGSSEEVVPSEAAVVATGVVAGVSVESAEGPEDLAAGGTSGAGFSGMTSSEIGVGVALRAGLEEQRKVTSQNKKNARMTIRYQQE